ncbi:hypothetical protein [Balneatrix alpica]|uniref:Preprotein translocase subunit YajC n=1 Tax=Balneatrix alpica TaxID=75684 RepID=A0ABV5Z6J0_9GAMM|nr:hypothetical protein [Balneatrix alpica]
MMWVVVAVALALLGSLFWILPSPKQRAQMLLREQARQLGLQVRMQKIQFPRAPGQLEDAPALKITYCLPSVQKQDKAVEISHWQLSRGQGSYPFNAAWVWLAATAYPEHKRAQLEEWLAELPLSCLAVWKTPLEYGVLWQEKDEQELRHLQQSLQAALKLHL